MAIIGVTVYKFTTGAECFVPDDSFGRIYWLENPDKTFVPLEDTEEQKCIKDNYCLVFGEPTSEEFCGESLDGVAYALDGDFDSEMGLTQDLWTDEWAKEEAMWYIAVAEHLVKGLMNRRKESEPMSWAYKYYIALSYWSTRDYFGDFDAGVERVGFFDNDKCKIVDLFGIVKKE